MKNKLFKKRALSLVAVTLLMLSFFVPLITFTGHAQAATSTFGKTDIGASLSGGTSALWGSKYQTPSDVGDTVNASVYLRFADATFRIGLYDTSYNLLAQTTNTSCSGSSWFNASITYTNLAPSTDYWIIAWTETSNPNRNYDAGTTGQYMYANAPAYADGFPETFPSDGRATLDRAYSMYVTFEVAEEPPVIVFDPCDDLTTNGTWGNPATGMYRSISNTEYMEGTGSLNITWTPTTNWGGDVLKYNGTDGYEYGDKWDFTDLEQISFSAKVIGTLPSGAWVPLTLKTPGDQYMSYYNLNGSLSSSQWTNYTFDLRSPDSGVDPDLTWVAYLGFGVWSVQTNPTFSILIDNITLTEGEPLPLVTEIDPATSDYGVVDIASTFTASYGVTGSEPYSYAWYVNGSVQGGETEDTFLYTPLAANVYNITVQITDGSASTSSASCMLTALAFEDATSTFLHVNKTLDLNQIRGAFFHTWTYLTINYTTLIANLKSEGINTIFLEVYTEHFWNTTTHTTQNHTVIQTAVNTFKAANFTVWACLTVGLSPPETRMYIQNAAGAYSSPAYGDPANPYFMDMLEQEADAISTNYNFDGFLWDYTRFSGLTYMYSSYMTDAYETYSGNTISSITQIQSGGAYYWDYIEFRMTLTDNIVETMHDIIAANEPDMQFAASPFPAFSGYGSYQCWVLGQHAANWVNEGWIDFVAPMIYENNIIDFEDQLESSIDFFNGGNQGKVPMVPLISTDAGQIAAISVSLFVEMVQSLQDHDCQGYVIWRYGGAGGFDARLDLLPYMTGVIGADLIPESYAIEDYSLTLDGTTATLTFDTTIATSVILQVSETALFTATPIYNELGRPFTFYDIDYVGGGTNQTNTGTSHSFTINGVSSATEFRLIINSSDSSMITPVYNIVERASTGETEPTYTIEVTAISPTSGSTLTTSTLNYNFTTTGTDTLNTAQIALYKSGVQVGSNITSMDGAFTDLTDGSYVVAISVTGLNGATDYLEVPFTVYLGSALSVTVSVSQPVSATYNTSRILISYSASGGTIDKMWFNIQNGSSWVYAEDQLYTAPVFVEDFIDGSYTFYGYANNTLGAAGYASVSFTVNIATAPVYVTPSILILHPLNITYVSGSIAGIRVEIRSFGSVDAVWFNVWNGTGWVYSSNLTYTGVASLEGLTDGTYIFYAFAANSAGGYLEETLTFTVYTPSFDISIDTSSFWQWLDNFDFSGFVLAVWSSGLGGAAMFFMSLASLISIAIYIRYQNLIAVGIIWLVVGSIFIAWIPLAAPFIIFCYIFGIASILYKLYGESRV